VQERNPAQTNMVRQLTPAMLRRYRITQNLSTTKNKLWWKKEVCSKSYLFFLFTSPNLYGKQLFEYYIRYAPLGKA
jgi:hypothetical protein